MRRKGEDEESDLVVSLGDGLANLGEEGGELLEGFDNSVVDELELRLDLIAGLTDDLVVFYEIPESLGGGGRGGEGGLGLNRFEDGGKVAREGGLGGDEEEDRVAEDGGVLEQVRAVLFELGELGVELVKLGGIGQQRPGRRGSDSPRRPDSLQYTRGMSERAEEEKRARLTVGHSDSGAEHVRRSAAAGGQSLALRTARLLGWLTVG